MLLIFSDGSIRRRFVEPRLLLMFWCWGRGLGRGSKFFHNNLLIDNVHMHPHRRHFIDDGALQKHFKTKPHKRRYCAPIPAHPGLIPMQTNHYGNQTMDGFMLLLSCLHLLPPPLPTHTHTHTARLQALREPVYTQKEAEMAAGVGNYVLQQPDTKVTNVDMDRTT